MRLAGFGLPVRILVSMWTAFNVFSFIGDCRLCLCIPRFLHYDCKIRMFCWPFYLWGSGSLLYLNPTSILVKWFQLLLNGDLFNVSYGRMVGLEFVGDCCGQIFVEIIFHFW